MACFVRAFLARRALAAKLAAKAELEELARLEQAQAQTVVACFVRAFLARKKSASCIVRAFLARRALFLRARKARRARKKSANAKQEELARREQAQTVVACIVRAFRARRVVESLRLVRTHQVKSGAIVRSGPELKSEAIGELRRGSRVTFRQATKNTDGVLRYWIQASECTGWISAKTVEEIDTNKTGV